MINKKLIGLVPESIRFILLTVLNSWISLIFNMSAIFAIAYLIEQLFMDQVTTTHIFITALFIFLSIGIRYTLTIKSTHYSHLASSSVKTKLRLLIYNKLLALGLSYGEKTSTSHIVQLSGEGIEQIEIYFSKYLPQFFYSLLAPLTLFTALSFINLKIALVLLICVPLIPASIIAVNKVSKKIFHKYWHSYTKLGDHFLDNLGGLTTLKIYEADNYYNEKMNQISEEFRKITMKVLTMQLNSVTLMDLIAYGGAGIGIIFTLIEFSRHTITLSQAITFILLASEFFIPLRLLGSFFHIAMNGVASATNIFKLLELQNTSTEGAQFSFTNGDIEIKNLSFNYVPETEILKNISLKIPQNSLISIVGESGSGKSTIAALLMGFKQDFTGSITIHNTPIHNFSEKSLMENLCIITHENYFFKGTIFENLTMANKTATPDDMLNVLQKVDLYDFVTSNGGLDFMLQENASNLSGGQAQRLALARALLHDAKIYIFDEATSSIDRESETVILSVIKELAHSKTIILISHRLANVISSDMIFVLEKGKLAEQGKHHTLLAEHGIYATLYNNQADLEAIYTGGLHHA